MFRRRTALTRRRKLREALWPSMGLKRTAVYYRHRLSRIQGTPHQVAGGIATGIAISFTPFVGFHILLGLLISNALRFSVLGMVLGTLIGGNPWTFPLIWVGSYKLGHAILGHDIPDASVIANKSFHLSAAVAHPMEWLVPMVIGSLPLAVLGWTLSYHFFKKLVAQFQAARIEKITRVLA